MTKNKVAKYLTLNLNKVGVTGRRVSAASYDPNVASVSGRRKPRAPKRYGQYSGTMPTLLLFFVRIPNLLLLLILLVGCYPNQGNTATEGLDATDQIRFQQYMVQGQQLYAKHCSNCHQEDGQGLGRLIPPLAQSDYLLADVDRTLCIIKYGLKGPVVVNGETYQQAMPGNETLKDIEIAQITTYIYNSWGNERGYVPVRRVSAQVDDCKR